MLRCSDEGPGGNEKVFLATMTRCPDCGRHVESIFDHLVIEDCALLSDEEVAAAMEEVEGDKA